MRLALSIVLALVPLAAVADGDLSMGIIIGNGTVVGNVTVSNDEDNLSINAAGTAEWRVTSVEIYVGRDAVPTNNPGNPLIGQFNAKENLPSPQASYTKTFSLSELGVACDDIVNSAIHFEMVNGSGSTSGAWANGANAFEGASWGRWFTYQIACADPCPGAAVSINSSSGTAYGEFQVLNDPTKMSLSLAPTGGWMISQVQMHATTGTVPMGSRTGSPDFNAFMHKEVFTDAVPTHTWQPELSSLSAACGSTLNLAARAVLRRTTSSGSIESVTVWASGTVVYAVGSVLPYAVCC